MSPDLIRDDAMLTRTPADGKYERVIDIEAESVRGVLQRNVFAFRCCCC